MGELYAMSRYGIIHKGHPHFFILNSAREGLGFLSPRFRKIYTVQRVPGSTNRLLAEHVQEPPVAR